jgi:S-adenosylmethionine decarboxylase proenzyme
MKMWIGFVMCLVASLSAEELHEFTGKHFLGSYIGCDKDVLGNVEHMLRIMDEAVLSSGATILNRSHYVFSASGLTVVYLLSESHASLHTYPEYGACFVDLFTCGEHCTSDGFDKTLRKYLNPEQGQGRFFLRHQGVEEIECY